MTNWLTYEAGYFVLSDLKSDSYKWVQDAIVTIDPNKVIALAENSGIDIEHCAIMLEKEVSYTVRKSRAQVISEIQSARDD